MFFLSLFSLVWAIPTLAAIIIIWGMEYDRNWVSPLTVLVALLGLQFLTDLDPYHFVINNPGTVAAYIAGYVIVGLVWVYAKMGFVISNAKAALRLALADFDAKPLSYRIGTRLRDEYSAMIKDGRIKDGVVVDEADALAAATAHQVESEMQIARNAVIREIMTKTTGREYMPIKISTFKARIINWMSLWPCSAFWTLLNDPIRKLYNALYNMVGNSLQKISDRAFAEF